MNPNSGRNSTMTAAGDDLRRHLIVPVSSAPTSSLADTSTSAEADTLRNWLQAKEKAKTTKMEIDYPPQPATLPSPYAADDHLSSNGVYKLDDFLNAHKAEHDAQILARETAEAAKHALPSSAKKIKTEENVAPVKPVAVGARSSRHTILLHEKYQALGIPQPVFTYNGGTESGWTVEISFPGIDAEELQGLSEKGSFNSKHEAKEAMSKQALEILEELEKQGKVTKAEKRKMRKSAGEPTPQQEKKEKESGPNYVGQLLEFQRATSAPQPTYTDYSAGTRFACLLHIDGHTDPFGSLESLYSSKKEARREAARHAIEYFKAQGQWPDDCTSVGGIKKKKVAQPIQPEPISTTGGGKESTTSNSTLTTTGTGTGTTSTGSPSYAQRVALLSTTLSLSTPEWHYTPHPTTKDFHTVSCFFRNGGPHEGPIGTVRNVFGKKKAKEECARLTLGYLEEVRAHRVSCGMRMLEGIGGREVVVGVAAGRVMEGEGEMEMEMGRRGRGVVVGGEERESEGEEEFEDAVEDLWA